MMYTVTAALQRRISIRAFLPRPVPVALVNEILGAAHQPDPDSPAEPWKVIVVSGIERDAVVALARRLTTGPDAVDEAGDDPIYPPNLWEPYRSRRYAIGEAMYATVGIERSDKTRRLRHVARNFELFDAPVAVFFVVDRRLSGPDWAPLGEFMLAVALVAQERGLGSCFQESWATVRESLRRHFNLPESEMIYCGMALGYPDPQAPINTLRSARASVEEFAQLRGFS